MQVDRENGGTVRLSVISMRKRKEQRVHSLHRGRRGLRTEQQEMRKWHTGPRACVRVLLPDSGYVDLSLTARPRPVWSPAAGRTLSANTGTCDSVEDLLHFLNKHAHAHAR